MTMRQSVTVVKPLSIKNVALCAERHIVMLNPSLVIRGEH